MSKKAFHNPQGNPCQKCGKALLRHRVDHKFNPTHLANTPTVEEVCVCGLPDRRHRVRKRDERDRDIEYFGIDGEGQGRKDHRYVLLAASNEDGSKTWQVSNDDRLSTVECLEMILQLPSKRAKIFSFSFNYDLTKMLTDLDDKSLYELFRPELRPSPKTDKGSKGPLPVRWKQYQLNLQGTKFSVRKGGRKVIIWDLFKFYQSKFVSALKEWKVGAPELHERMAKMKDKRSEFDTIYLESACPECGADQQALCVNRKIDRPHDARVEEGKRLVLEYCQEECRCISELARKLIESHEKADLKLKSFYGAGSSGAAILSKLNIQDKVRQPIPEMREAVASAFFGGRFENSIIGEIHGKIYNRDISSAYPYGTAFLPCLEHAKWTRTNRRDRLDGARTALVRYSLSNSRVTSWGPFPFRTENGSISFPIESGGGWVWLTEYLAGERIFSNVRFHEAWVYSAECDCQPFAEIPKYYVLRLQIGKEGPGIVIKLAVNSCYGKLAQSVGSAIYNCWIWAGIITSGCRAQVLDMLGLHKDWSNLIAIATDGIYTREKIIAPEPIETGTGIIINGSSKPLGGWEEKEYDRGMFFARPGIYFPLNPTAEDIKDIKGRGVGKGVVLENWQRIVDAWNADGIDAIARVANVTRFCGAKTSISSSARGYNRANAKDGIAPAYGQWIKRKVEMSFHPKPKREAMNADGTLKLRRFPQHLTSVPYKRAMRSQEAIEMMRATLEALEQPDADLTDYEMEDV